MPAGLTWVVADEAALDRAIEDARREDRTVMVSRRRRMHGGLVRVRVAWLAREAGDAERFLNDCRLYETEAEGGRSG